MTFLSAQAPCGDGSMGPPFDHMALLVRFGEKRITLTRDRLIVTRNGAREERAVSAEEWNGVLRDTFGIAWPGASSGSRTADSPSSPRG